MKILFATSEMQPLIKTGGLADVCGSLPKALRKLKHDVRVILPAYRSLIEKISESTRIAKISVVGVNQPVEILEAKTSLTDIPVYLVHYPEFFDRPGGPYTGVDGHDWPDNPQRFALFARAVTTLLEDETLMHWRPDVVHCHDWQAGLIPPLLEYTPRRPGTVFTIHNLGYQGNFSWDTFASLQLPYELWSMHALEFYGQMSFIKGGIAFADEITTVSPTYAEEIQTPDFGWGMEGILQHREDHLHGILNGVDYDEWNPSKDPHLVSQYNARNLKKKTENKLALQKTFDLPVDENAFLLGQVGRMVEQKGIDLILESIPALMQENIQLIVLGSGQKQYEDWLNALKEEFPEKIGVYIGYNEAMAHQVEAGVDLFLMPSRFEPCGLNQIYSLKYGTPPVVRRTGGLADTVVNVTTDSLQDNTGNGFVFEQPDSHELTQSILIAQGYFKERKSWQKIMRNAMRQDFSWTKSAKAYLELYAKACSKK